MRSHASLISAPRDFLCTNGLRKQSSCIVGLPFLFKFGQLAGGMPRTMTVKCRMNLAMSSRTINVSNTY